MLKEKFTLFNFVALLFCLAMSAASVTAQTDTNVPKRINSPFSQNPKIKSKSTVVETPELPEKVVNIEPAENTDQTLTAANKTLEVVKRANNKAIVPTEIYKIGIGDVLFVSLQNAPAKNSTYFTVLSDGTIDYPLAGEMVNVAGLTNEEVEELLEQKIKLYESPQVSVKIRQYESHSFTVLGLVEQPGEKFMEREAIPLFIARAKAVVQSRANLAVITRADQQIEKIDLNDSKSDAVLIFSGDVIEFRADGKSAANAATPPFYYIGGLINSAGQKDFTEGITLTQAIIVAGGTKKSNAKKATIRRKNDEGLLSPIEFDLAAIKAGKQPDPVLQAGDTVEIEN